jgi:hypothetical protein
LLAPLVLGRLDVEEVPRLLSVVKAPLRGTSDSATDSGDVGLCVSVYWELRLTEEAPRSEEGDASWHHLQLALILYLPWQQVEYAPVGDGEGRTRRPAIDVCIVVLIEIVVCRVGVHP